MAIDLAALKTELETNPASMPYLALVAANDQSNADIINNSDGNNPRTLNQDTILTSQFVGGTTYAAYDGLSAAERTYYDMLVGRESIAVTPDTLANLAGIGGTSRWAVSDRPTMEPRVAALMQYTGSRAEEISDTLGASRVAPIDIADARSLP